MVLSNQSCFWKKNLHFDYGFLRNFRVSFDYEWFLRISEHVKFKKINYKPPLASFVIYNSQKSQNYSKRDYIIRSKIKKFYLKKFKLPNNFILLFILSKLSKLFRFITLITNGDFFLLFKKK